MAVTGEIRQSQSKIDKNGVERVVPAKPKPAPLSEFRQFPNEPVQLDIEDAINGIPVAAPEPVALSRLTPMNSAASLWETIGIPTVFPGRRRVRARGKPPDAVIPSKKSPWRSGPEPLKTGGSVTGRAPGRRW